MKRFIFTMLSLSALSILFFTSCVNDDSENFLKTKTIYYSVKKTDWKWSTKDESGGYWFCEFKEPLLTQNIFNNGMAVAYLSIEGRLTPLPFSDFWTDRDYKWEEQVTCELEPGWVTFIFKADDHDPKGVPYYDYDFVLKLAW